MHIIEEHNKMGWITAQIEGRWVQAKVYDRSSTFGINDGRVCKLSISKTGQYNRNLPFFGQMEYSYDRDTAFDNLPDDLLDKIVNELEVLPIAND